MTVRGDARLALEMRVIGKSSVELSRKQASEELIMRHATDHTDIHNSQIARVR